VGNKGAVLAARVTNDPGVSLRGGKIFVANIGDDRAELLYRVAIIFGSWQLAAGSWQLAAGCWLLAAGCYRSCSWLR